MSNGLQTELEGLESLEATPLKSAFTPSQIQHYLKHISFSLPLSHPRDARFLQTLHRCQITSIPYENLSLHYNPAHENSIDPLALYAKFLPDFHDKTTTSRGRGGFCFETTVFFLHVLRGLGFRAYPTSARIRIRDHFTRVPAGPFVGPRHGKFKRRLPGHTELYSDRVTFQVVNLVLLDDGSVWSTDVGFGGDGPTSPLLLATGQEEPKVINNLGAQEIRLRHGVFPDTVREEANNVWLYEYRNDPDAEWNTYYAFGETEASPWDLECANFWVMAHPESFQRKQILAVKFIRCSPEAAPRVGKEEISEVEVVGKVMLADGVLKKNTGGKTRVLKECRTEKERVEVLREYFGIHLTDEQREGIKGFITELKG